MFAVNVHCICFEKGKEETILELKISEVKVTPSVTSVESSSKFWLKIIMLNLAYYLRTLILSSSKDSLQKAACTLQY